MSLQRPSTCIAVCLISLVSFPASSTFAQKPDPPSPSFSSSTLAPKLQKELGKAIEDLHAGSLAKAQQRLEAVQKAAPDDSNVNFILGICAAQRNDFAKANEYWESVLKSSPEHLGALLSIGNAKLRENNPSEALPYLSRAAQAQPSAWRAHALLADALLRQGSLDESIKHASLALELAHGHAGALPLVLAKAFLSRGDTEHAAALKSSYLREHDIERNGNQGSAQSSPGEAIVDFVSLIPSSWLPPDLDDLVPPVDPAVSCNVKEILQKSGSRIQELVTNVDRFTATENVTHESFDKWGFPSPPQKFKFNYFVSMQESSPGILSVEEFRNGTSGLGEFPDGIATRGLPALVLIFHPFYSVNFEMTCEGLGQWNSEPAWQIYFRQRPDKPNLIRVHRLGLSGPAYSSPLKGRAWFSAQSFQIVRLESSLISPVPQIRLATDRAAIEYGPVHFQSQEVDLWLPRTAEIFYDWIGRRAHRLHRFDNYFLFSVEDKQHISAPKTDTPVPSNSSPTEPPAP